MPPEEENIGVITYRLGAIENTINDVSESMKQLVILEQKHIETREALQRAFQSISTHDQRITKIEAELPTLTLTRGWVISAAIGIITLATLAFVKFVK
jgi:hypothetical protein